MSEAIANSLSLDEVVGTVTTAAIDEVSADAVQVLLDDGEGGFFERARVRQSRVSRDRFRSREASIERLNAHFKHERRLKSTAARVCSSSRSAARRRLCSLIVDAHDDVGADDRLHGRVQLQPGQDVRRRPTQAAAHRRRSRRRAIENAKLYENLKGTFRQTIRGLASAIDKMDRYTAGHSERVAAYSQLLAIKLGLSRAEIEIIHQSALMHDIGKLGCVLNLNKPGILTEREYEIFKKHPGYGKDILQPIDFLHPLIPGVHCHHERWDGTGYPLGMQGKDIPLMARIISVADVYDAMTSDRAYRKALPHEATISEINRCAGTQFDPTVANEFMDAIEHHRKERRERGEPLPE